MMNWLDRRANKGVTQFFNMGWPGLGDLMMCVILSLPTLPKQAKRQIKKETT
jgi:hypothetical protein